MKETNFDHLFHHTFRDFEGDDANKAEDWAILESRLDNIAVPPTPKSKIGQRLLFGLLALLLALNGCWFLRQFNASALKTNSVLNTVKNDNAPSSNPSTLALSVTTAPVFVQDTQRRKVIVYDTIHKQVIVYKTVVLEEKKTTQSNETTTALMYTPEGKLLGNQTTTTEKKETIKTTTNSNFKNENEGVLSDISLDTMQKSTNIVLTQPKSDSVVQHFLSSKKTNGEGIKVEKRTLLKSFLATERAFSIGLQLGGTSALQFLEGELKGQFTANLRAEYQLHPRWSVYLDASHIAYTYLPFANGTDLDPRNLIGPIEDAIKGQGAKTILNVDLNYFQPALGLQYAFINRPNWQSYVGVGTSRRFVSRSSVTYLSLMPNNIYTLSESNITTGFSKKFNSMLNLNLGANYKINRHWRLTGEAATYTQLVSFSIPHIPTFALRGGVKYTF
jgi:Outer membrane protein beta-barrel domain